MKTITLQPWQQAALAAGRLKAVWLELPGELVCKCRCHDPSANFVGMHIAPCCDMGAMRGGGLMFGWKDRLPYAVGDVVELEDNAGTLVVYGEDGNLYPFRLTITSVEVRETASATANDIEQCGVDGWYDHDLWHDRHPWLWSMKLGLEVET